MGSNNLESLKQEIEEYRKLLEEELAAENHTDGVDRVIELSRKLDKLIIKYEQAIKINNRD
ncbi:MAG: Spo0E family sporulation regulatory protein-aspartic acid phosphatase [Clostridiales bacterium]|nr:Spo0E family sporulation regulatory protein-aspartic acid phosphatase [Clostridiales bacterium]